MQTAISYLVAEANAVGMITMRIKKNTVVTTTIVFFVSNTRRQQS